MCSEIHRLKDAEANKTKMQGGMIAKQQTGCRQQLFTCTLLTQTCIILIR